MELRQHGRLESLNVCDNSADHLVGNVYAKFNNEEDASKAIKALDGRPYAGRPIEVEPSPVRDFREATCRQYEEGVCTRGSYCNFLHLKPISREMRRELHGESERDRFERERMRERDRYGYGNDDRDRYGPPPDRIGGPWCGPARGPQGWGPPGRANEWMHTG